ncbi:related to TUL1 RING-domain E3 ubiquitin ligase [Cephalotrichum gorgonifer]|uniref:DSC E3 ubiquitin ligase complex subunit A n=1 Tax=Cephalotrichum gorgonifer TaxID=2041049 RepID=A0AAE8SS43_9PEZI|nr:related to TUL1 RING-domain E3 ubiquitin ligase [Cephalotrichum gorgonifer]
MPVEASPDGIPPTPRPSPREYSRTLPLVLIILGWLFFFPDNPVTLLSVSEVAANRLDAQHSALSVLNSTKWGDFTPVVPDGAGDSTGDHDGSSVGDDGTNKEGGKEEEKEGDGEQEGEEPAGPRFLNLTGFREGDGLAWDDLGSFRERCLATSRAAIPPTAEGDDRWLLGEGEPVWQNVSGHLHGTWARHDASVSRQAISYNLTAVAPDIDWTGARSPWARNVTGREGRMKVRLHDRAGPDGDGGDPGKFDANMARAEVTIEDADGSGSTWDMRLHGLHWRRHGALLLTTTSEKFDGIFALPHLSPGPEFFESGQKVLNDTITTKLKERARYLSFDARIPWTSDIQDVDIYSPSPHCEYIMYAQVYPPDREELDMRSFDPETDSMAGVISDIEQELKSPFGNPIRGVPELQLSAVIYSPDCAFFLETKGPPDYPSVDGRHLVGMKAEIFRSRLNTCLLTYALIFAAQIYLLKQQIRETSTPSTMGRVSFYTGAMMLMADALVMGLMAALVLSSESSLQALTLMFCAFTSLLVGGTFLYQVFDVQQQEWIRRREREAARNPPQTQPQTRPQPSSGPPSSAPTSSTPSRPASPPIIIPSDQDIDAEIEEVTRGGGSAGPSSAEAAPTFSSAISRVALLNSCLFFLLVASTAWYPPARSALVNVVVAFYLSLWAPQIYRNAQRNCRRAFSRRFVVGQSLLRLAPVAYFYCVEDNVAFVRPDRTAFLALAAWVWIQLWILTSQDVLGPRFGVPKGWVPPAWDYHPILRLDALESGALPLALTPEEADVAPSSAAGTAAGTTPGSKTVDCAICRENLELPILPARGAHDAKGDGVAAVLGSRGYMVTPCRHVFHTTCLEGWMVFRLQCPICREDLPPL